MRALTNFGNALLLLPLSLLMAAWLWRRASAGLARVWLLAVVAASAVIALLKIDFSVERLAPLKVHSPSGHACLSTLVYGGLALLASPYLPRGRPLVLAVICAAWVIAIGASRVLLEVHTWQEVVAGTLIGGVALAGFARVYLRHSR